MRKFGVSQLPVIEEDKFVGSIEDAQLISALGNDPSARDKEVRSYMGKPFPIVQSSDPLSAVSKHFTDSNGAVLVDLGQGRYQIITRHDLVAAMGC